MTRIPPNRPLESDQPSTNAPATATEASLFGRLSSLNLGTQPPSAYATPRAAIELKQPPGFRGRYGHPDYPFPDKRTNVFLEPPDLSGFEKSFEEYELERYNLRAQGKYPNPSAFALWPPLFVAENSVQHRDIQRVIKGDALPPASVKDGNSTTLGKTQPKPFVVTVMDPSPFATSSSHDVWGARAQGTPSEMPASVKEAYILRPTSNDMPSKVELSYKLVSLPLTIEQIDAHIRKFTAHDDSLIQAVSSLEPEIWDLMEAQMKKRHGNLVFVESHSCQLHTGFGHLTLPAISFIIDVSVAQESGETPGQGSCIVS